MILRKSSIGDVVLASCCLDFLRRLGEKTHQRFEITWVGSPITLELLKHFYPSIKTASYLNKEVKYGAFDIFVDLQGNLRTKLIFLRLFCFSNTRPVAMSKRQLFRQGLIFRSRFFGRFYPARKIPKEVFQWQLMLSTLKRGLATFFTSEILDSIQAHPYLTHAGKTQNLAIAPGAQHKTKRMPEKMFTEILQIHLEKFIKTRADEQNFTVYLLGDERDFSIAEMIRVQFKDFLDFVTIENLAGKTNLIETCNILATCRLTLSNDSSVAHLSEASGTEVFSFFGPTVALFGFRPWMVKSRALEAKLGCRPCSKHGKIACRYGDQLCFHLIQTESTAELMDL